MNINGAFTEKHVARPSPAMSSLPMYRKKTRLPHRLPTFGLVMALHHMIFRSVFALALNTHLLQAQKMDSGVLRVPFPALS
jgi:hypothetical protein